MRFEIYDKDKDELFIVDFSKPRDCFGIPEKHREAYDVFWAEGVVDGLALIFGNDRFEKTLIEDDKGEE